MTTDQPRADAIAALDDLVERWHAWNATDDPDLKVMLGLGLMQDAFDALPNLAALAESPVTPDLRAALTDVRRIIERDIIRVARYYWTTGSHIETFSLEALSTIDRALASPDPEAEG